MGAQLTDGGSNGATEDGAEAETREGRDCLTSFGSRAFRALWLLRPYLAAPLLSPRRLGAAPLLRRH